MRKSDSVGDQVLGKTAEIGGNIKDIGLIVKEAMSEKLAEFGHDALLYGKQGRDRLLQLRDDAAGYVEKRPLKALLFAAGAGVLLSMLWRRR